MSDENKLERCLELLGEINDYLKSNTRNVIGHNCLFHQEIQEVLGEIDRDDVANWGTGAHCTCLGLHADADVIETDGMKLMDAGRRHEAYQKFEQRGFADGSELDDWLEAERDLHGLAGRQSKSTA